MALKDVVRKIRQTIQHWGDVGCFTTFMDTEGPIKKLIICHSSSSSSRNCMEHLILQLCIISASSLKTAGF